VLRSTPARAAAAARRACEAPKSAPRPSRSRPPLSAARHARPASASKPARSVSPRVTATGRRVSFSRMIASPAPNHSPPPAGEAGPPAPLVAAPPLLLEEFPSVFRTGVGATQLLALHAALAKESGPASLEQLTERVGGLDCERVRLLLEVMGSRGLLDQHLDQHLDQQAGPGGKGPSGSLARWQLRALAD